MLLGLYWVQVGKKNSGEIKMDCQYCPKGLNAQPATHRVQFWNVYRGEESLLERTVCQHHLEFVQRAWHVRVVLALHQD